MNKSFLKFVADFGPLLIFFTIYYKSGNNLAVAIPPLIISTIIAVVAYLFIRKKNTLYSITGRNNYIFVRRANFIFLIIQFLFT